MSSFKKEFIFIACLYREKTEVASPFMLFWGAVDSEIVSRWIESTCDGLEYENYSIALKND